MVYSALQPKRGARGLTTAILAASTALLTTGAAQAADEIPSGSWSGVYVGVHAGVGAFTGQAMDWSGGPFGDLFVGPSGDFDLNDFAAFGGVQVGYNRQTGNVVYGIEGDWSWTGYDQDRFFDDDYYVKTGVDWLATLRGRLGLAEGNAMAYVTGGLAIAHLSHCANNSAAPCSIDGDENIAWDGTRLGFVVGAGVEAALSERLSLKGEYLFVQMDKQNVVYDTDQDQDIDFSNHSHQLRLGLNYHFDALPTATYEAGSGTWSGFYVGVHGGVGAFTGRAIDWDEDVFSTVDGDIDLNAFGGLAGVQAGYNRQAGNIVYGVEGDWSWTGFSEDRTFDDEDYYVKAEMDWLGTVRGRLGVAAGNAMAYVTGGLAIAHLRHCANDNPSEPCSIDGDDDIAWDGTKLGLVAGAGVEAALSERLSLKGEYLFVQMDKQNVIYDADDDEDIDFSNRSHQVRLGLNYHFGGLPTTLYEDAVGSWNGVYAGVHGGGGAFTGRAMDWDRGIFSVVSGDVDLNAFAALGGVQAGYNHQVGNIVYGLEGDFSWTGFGEGRVFGENDRNYAKAEMDWLATLRGRLGVASGNAMAYVTGGLAVAHLGHCANEGLVGFAGNTAIVELEPCSTNNDDDIAWDGTKLGLVAGVGAEAKLTDRVSLKGEYLFVQMDKQNIVYNTAEDNDIDFSNRSHQFRIGLNYHFGQR